MISIFAKETFLNINPSEPLRLRTKPIPEGRGHAMRVSSMIRGDQIADEIGAKFNPTEGYENDTCIYVKPMVRKGDDFKFKGKKIYLDIVDGHNLGQLMIKYPEVKVIVCSDIDKITMSSCIPNEIVVIPQHHCNYERIQRERTEIKTVGVIGTKGAFPMLPKELKGELKKRGMKLLEYSRFFTRQDIIDFYMKIDVQIIWRPYKKTLSNPLKMVNASSFGIPTIALDEKAFHEMSGCYIPVDSLEGFLTHLDALKDNPSLYRHYSKACLAKSEHYHISNIGKLYKQL
jgi:hypothetical protein